MTYRKLLAENAGFRHSWLGQVISEIGQWLNNIAVHALTLELAGAESEGRADLGISVLFVAMGLGSVFGGRSRVGSRSVRGARILDH